MLTRIPRPRKVKHWVMVVAMTILAAGVCWFIDFPAIGDPMPQPLSGAGVGPDAAFDVCLLGGFIDRNYCWRIDAREQDVARIIGHLELRPSPAIPKEFWRARPFYWPRKAGTGMVPYRSASFTDDSRGADGAHYFLLHDTRKNRAYVLFKDNF